MRRFCVIIFGMKKRLFFQAFLLIFFANSHLFSLTAKEAVSGAAEYRTVDESIEYLKKSVPNLKTAADRRSIYAFLGSVQEQAGLYADAQKSYAQAAAIDAGDAKGMPKKSNEQLVLDAVRCALSMGDSATADKYLSSAVKNSKDEKIIAYTKLYAQWSALCKAGDFSETLQVVQTLKSYADAKSMKSVRPQILLTLFHITGEESYSKKLKSDFPNSMEAGIVSGKVKILPTPFWFFVPRKETQEEVAGSPPPNQSVPTEKKSVQQNQKTPENSENQSNSASSAKNQKTDEESGVKLQLGLFRDESNAKALAEQLSKKGFNAKIQKETRPSGNAYYLVYVPENKAGTVAGQLKKAGFESYPLE